MKHFSLLLIVTLLMVAAFAACGGTEQPTPPKVEKTDMKTLDKIAETYVKLCFHVGKTDKDYVDAYFGPEKLKKEAEAENKTLDDVKAEAKKVLDQLKKMSLKDADADMKWRHRTLVPLVAALEARAQYLSGKKMTFDEESMAYYNAVSPSFTNEYYEAALKELEELLPGKAPLSERINNFKKQFVIPADKVEAVFKVVIEEARKRTKAHIPLMENETFDLEYVKNEPWGAYNWFKGNSRSLIQVNTDIPMGINRAVGLACHEGYPGHHVFHSLIEKRFYREKGWVEFSIYPLFSPLSFISEGTANFGVEVAFPKAERIKYEKEVIWPMAGLDTSKAELFYKVSELTSRLSFGGNDTTRLYIDGKITKEEAVERFMKYQLRSRSRAEKYMSFIDRYRSYVINYNLGLKMVREYIEKKGGTKDNPEKRWEEFAKLLNSPVLAGDLK